MANPGSLDDPVIGELRNRFGPDAFTVQATRTGIPVVWVKREQLLEIIEFLRSCRSRTSCSMTCTVSMSVTYPPRRSACRGFFRFLSPAVD